MSIGAPGISPSLLVTLPGYIPPPSASLVSPIVLNSLREALLLTAPTSVKIPQSKESRLPSNIPLRTLPSRTSSEQRHVQGSSAIRDNSARRSSFGSESSWTDTGDIGDQLDDHDPVRLRLPDDVEDEILSGVSGRQRRQKKVRIYEPSSRRRDRSTSHTGLVDKGAIRIPTVRPRRPTIVHRWLGSIMSGSSGSATGLTGQALVYFTSVFVSLGVFLFGYDQGVMSGILTGPHFIDYFHHPSKAEMGTMVAILEIGAFISSLVVGRVGDIIGRRRTIFYGSCIFFVGGALQTGATSMGMMMLGRIIAGLGFGVLPPIVPVSHSEIPPPHNRGKLACIEFSGNIIGYTTSVWVDYFCGFIDNDYSWRAPLFLQCVMGALLGLGSLIIVESPR